MELKKYIRSIPDYPKKGILFRDITTLIKNPEAFKFTVDKIIEISEEIELDKCGKVSGRTELLKELQTVIFNPPKKIKTPCWKTKRFKLN